MSHDLEKLGKLSRFESLFHRDNLFLGLRMWLRVNLAMLAIAFLLGLTGLLDLIGVSGLAALMMVSFFLYQWSAALEARKLYSFIPSPWCWWSIVWRMIAFMLPVFFVMLLVAGPVQPNSEGKLSESELQEISNIQLITAFLSIIPMGLVTSQALRASLKGSRAVPRSGPGGGDRGDG